MSTEHLDRFIERLSERFPAYPVVVRPYRSPDDPSIEHFVDILLVPQSHLHDVAMQGWAIAFDVFGEEPLRFLMSTVSIRSSQRFFVHELQAALGIGFEFAMPIAVRADAFSLEWMPFLASGTEASFGWRIEGQDPFAAESSAIVVALSEHRTLHAPEDPEAGDFSASPGRTHGQRYVLAA